MLIKFVGSIVAAIALAACGPAGAQSQAKAARIGVLWQTAPPPPVHPHVAAMLKGLQQLGWQDGKTAEFEFRYGGSDAARLATFAQELVRQKVDVIVTLGDLATRAAQQTTTAVPIVAVVGFPVESGFVSSLARPGGNITGVAVFADDLAAKRLELLKELLPRLSRVALLWDSVTHERQRKAAEAAARSLGLQIHVLPVKSGGEFEGAFETAAAARADAALVLVSPMFIANRSALVRLASKHRLPAMYTAQAFTEVGGLIAYGPGFDEIWRLGADIIDKILRGARPADLPVQRPVKLDLYLNLRTAREIGVEVPRSILLRADEVIE